MINTRNMSRELIRHLAIAYKLLADFNNERDWLTHYDYYHKQYVYLVACLNDHQD